MSQIAPLSDPNPLHQATPTFQRRRTSVACGNCRKRKIRCVTNEVMLNEPCARCKMRKLECEFHRWAPMLVPDDLAMDSTDSESVHTSASSIAGMRNTAPNCAARSEQFPRPSSSPYFQPESIHPPTQGYLHHRHQQPHHQMSALYLLQAAQARQYLDNRNLGRLVHRPISVQPIPIPRTGVVMAQDYSTPIEIPYGGMYPYTADTMPSTAEDEIWRWNQAGTESQFPQNGSNVFIM
ncbi:hypothetical protein FB45DRAFT_1137934 [Roridomyces roridus]|uniref:Zn(2)-C6 fungal-type domain-containing protein n=1 Tax=Roridomyces roridus TaxID=1738132 RepID=A0AAD7C129_9AGAR|nr:hypothetical protein FB45DRAFT_1137934 [Roridomyces roridus]